MLELFLRVPRLFRFLAYFFISLFLIYIFFARFFFLSLSLVWFMKLYSMKSDVESVHSSSQCSSSGTHHSATSNASIHRTSTKTINGVQPHHHHVSNRSPVCCTNQQQQQQQLPAGIQQQQFKTNIFVHGPTNNPFSALINGGT